MNDQGLKWMKKIVFLLCGCFSCISISCTAQNDIKAAQAMVRRIIPDHARHFTIELINDVKGYDIFEIESRHNKIIVRGNNGVAIASGLYYYLNEFTHCQVTWNGVNLNLPDTLPKVTKKVIKTTPHKYRYYLNYCTFNYSMSWWNWERWEREIDWMALHGISMPLSLTGQEYTWYQVYKEMGFSPEDLQKFFTGPAYFAWFWMGNIDAWGGPLPVNWMEDHRDLQQKIINRMRELGMKPVLPAFTGHVPSVFKDRFPQAKLKKTNWGNGFADTYILDPEDPMFEGIGRRFLEVQTNLYGTDHLYSADTFNENEPPSDDPEYLKSLSGKVYEGMYKVDKDAVWVMQGWLFYSDRKFWKAPQIQALLDGVPNDKMIILDLATEIEPVWKRTEAFYGKPWIWNMLHNFGGNISMFGRIETVAHEPPKALKDSVSGQMVGIGLTMEGIEQNPVLYELMTSHTWRDSPIDLNVWIKDYIRNRYGRVDEFAVKAWETLISTVYNGKEIRDGAESIIVARPTLENGRRWTKTKLNYEPGNLLPAWDNFIKAISDCRQYDGFRYDLVDVTRQVLANYAFSLHEKWVKDYQNKNKDAFAKSSLQFLELIDDIDLLLGTRKEFLLGTWISDARSWGKNEDEKALYERNARNLITLWGDADNGLYEYSCRQWNGLLKDFYKPRWEKFFEILSESLKSGQEINIDQFEISIRQWEWRWVNNRSDYAQNVSGDAVKIAEELHQKYRQRITQEY